MESLLSLVTSVAYAASETIPFVEKVKKAIINPLITLLFALALIAFLVGVVEFMMNSDSEEGRKKGLAHLLYGLGGLVIMVSVFGIIRAICSTIGLSC